MFYEFKANFRGVLKACDLLSPIEEMCTIDDAVTIFAMIDNVGVIVVILICIESRGENKEKEHAL